MSKVLGERVLRARGLVGGFPPAEAVLLRALRPGVGFEGADRHQALGGVAVAASVAPILRGADAGSFVAAGHLPVRSEVSHELVALGIDVRRDVVHDPNPAERSVSAVIQSG